MRGQRALRVLALVAPAFALGALRQDHVVARHDDAALALRLAGERVVVALAALELVCLHHLNVAEVADPQRDEHGQAAHEHGEAAAQGRAPQHAAISGVGGRVELGAADLHGPGHLGGKAGCFVARLEQQAHDDEAGDEAAAALAHEGQGDAGEGNEPGGAAHDDEGLQADARRKAGGGEGRHVALGAGCSGKAAHGEEHEEDQHGRCAQKTHLLGDGAEDEVAFHHGDGGAQAAPDADAEEAAVGKRVEALHQLVAAVLGVDEGVAPDGHAGLHVVEEAIEDHAARSRQRQAQDHVAQAARAHVDHGEEDPEEQQRAAQVLLEDDHEHGHEPHAYHGQHGTPVGHRQAQRPAPEGAQHLAVVCEVARQEEHDAYLGQLAGLEAHPGDGQPDAAAVVLAADHRQHGAQQQEQAHQQDHVAVARELFDAGNEHDGEHHAGNAGEEPSHLLEGGFLGREAQDEADADARQQEDHRQDARVCLRREEAREDVRHREGGDEPQRHGKGGEAELDALVDQEHGKEQQHHGRRRYEEPELCRPAGTHGAPLLALGLGAVRIRLAGGTGADEVAVLG